MEGYAGGAAGPATPGQGAPTILDVYTLQVRLESQLEQALQLLGAMRETITDHEARIRALESAVSEDTASGKNVRIFVEDHEKRLRSVEKWVRALPLSTLIALIAAVGSLVSAFLAR